VIIELNGLPPEGRRIQGEDPASILDLQADRLAREHGPVCYDLRVQLVSGELLVLGRLHADVAFRCSRCAEYFVCRVDEPRFEYMAPVKAGDAYVDLTAEIREATILAFPSCPVCRSECAGLCPQCGRNRNEGPCDCKPPDDTRWGALDNLKPQ
jgi:uncharacterized protein